MDMPTEIDFDGWTVDMWNNSGNLCGCCGEPQCVPPVLEYTYRRVSDCISGFAPNAKTIGPPAYDGFDYTEPGQLIPRYKTQTTVYRSVVTASNGATATAYDDGDVVDSVSGGVEENVTINTTQISAHQTAASSWPGSNIPFGLCSPESGVTFSGVPVVDVDVGAVHPGNPSYVVPAGKILVVVTWTDIRPAVPPETPGEDAGKYGEYAFRMDGGSTFPVSNAQTEPPGPYVTVLLDDDDDTCHYVELRCRVNDNWSGGWSMPVKFSITGEACCELPDFEECGFATTGFYQKDNIGEDSRTQTYDGTSWNMNCPPDTFPPYKGNPPLEGDCGTVTITSTLTFTTSTRIETETRVWTKNIGTLTGAVITGLKATGVGATAVAITGLGATGVNATGVGISGGKFSSGTYAGGSLNGIPLLPGQTIEIADLDGAVITGGSVVGSTVSGGTVNNGTFGSGGGLAGGHVGAGGLTTGNLVTGTLSGGGGLVTGSLSGGTLTMGGLTTGTLSGGSLTTGTLTTGTLTGGGLTTGTLTGGTLVTGDLTTGTLTGGGLTTGNLTTGTLTTGTLTVGSLSGGGLSGGGLSGGGLSGGGLSGGKSDGEGEEETNTSGEDEGFTGWKLSSRHCSRKSINTTTRTYSNDRNGGRGSTELVFSSAKETRDAMSNNYGWGMSHGPGGSYPNTNTDDFYNPPGPSAWAAGIYPITNSPWSLTTGDATGPRNWSALTATLRDMRYRFSNPLYSVGDTGVPPTPNSNRDGNHYKVWWDVLKISRKWDDWKRAYYNRSNTLYRWHHRLLPTDPGYPQPGDYPDLASYNQAIDMLPKDPSTPFPPAPWVKRTVNPASESTRRHWQRINPFTSVMEYKTTSELRAYYNLYPDPGAEPAKPVVMESHEYLWEEGQTGVGPDVSGTCDPSKPFRDDPSPPVLPDPYTTAQYNTWVAATTAYNKAKFIRDENRKRTSPWYYIKADALAPEGEDFFYQVGNVRFTCDETNPLGPFISFAPGGNFPSSVLPDMDPTKITRHYADYSSWFA